MRTAYRLIKQHPSMSLPPTLVAQGGHVSLITTKNFLPIQRALLVLRVPPHLHNHHGLEALLVFPLQCSPPKGFHLVAGKIEQEALIPMAPHHFIFRSITTRQHRVLITITTIPHTLLLPWLKAMLTTVSASSLAAMVVNILVSTA